MVFITIEGEREMCALRKDGHLLWILLWSILFSAELFAGFESVQMLEVGYLCDLFRQKKSSLL